MIKKLNVSDIIEGHLNEALNKGKDLSESRMQICRNCNLYTEGILGPICDGTKCVDSKTQLLTTQMESPSIICGCGCRLLAKTTLKNAHCVLNKW